MYKYHSGLLPSVFDSFLTNLGSSHSYNTSSQNEKCDIGWAEHLEHYTNCI